jgi:hypothetical protein
MAEMKEVILMIYPHFLIYMFYPRRKQLKELSLKMANGKDQNHLFVRT